MTTGDSVLARVCEQKSKSDCSGWHSMFLRAVQPEKFIISEPLDGAWLVLGCLKGSIIDLVLHRAKIGHLEGSIGDLVKWCWAIPRSLRVMQGPKLVLKYFLGVCW